MTSISIGNDKQFKAALAALDNAQRRQVATVLVRQVLDLCADSRVRGALDLAQRADAGGAELSVVAAGVNSARVESYTQCGHDTDWACQASHFVARAAHECVKPAVDLTAAWEAAMQARMARICQTLAAGEGTDNHEAEAQYRALEAFLQVKGSAS
jgi:hypothetical protein